MWEHESKPREGCGSDELLRLSEALVSWARSVEERLPQPAECPPARPLDANTAALVRAAGMREAAKSQASTAPPSGGKCKCGGEYQPRGPGKVCDKCGQYVRNKPQSAWVPDPREADSGSFSPSAAMAEEIRELRAKLATAEATIENLRRCLAARGAWVMP